MPADSRATVAALDAMVSRITAASAAAARKGAMALQAAGMRNSPVVRGTLRRSWRTQIITSGPSVFAARVGPTIIYARRIELGFKGTDSLGRLYDQAPKPYAKPAFENVIPGIRATAISELARAVKG